MTGIVSFLIGMLFVVLGVVGEYVGRIFESVQGRPLFLVAESLGAERSAAAGTPTRPPGEATTEQDS